MLFQVAVAQGFMYLVSRHPTFQLHDVTFTKPTSDNSSHDGGDGKHLHPFYQLKYVNAWIFFRKNHSFCSGVQQATLPASAHGARPTTVSPCNCTEAARPARKTWPTLFLQSSLMGSENLWNK